MDKNAIEVTNESASHPSIVKTEGVCGGDACIAGTRIPVWVLEHARRLGFSDEELLEDYPTLGLDSLQAAWKYVETYRGEVEQLIKENDDEAPHD